jgi:hypothetical protein
MTDLLFPQLDAVSMNTASVADQIASSQSAANETYSAIADLLASAGGAGITLEEYIPGMLDALVSELPAQYTPYAAFSYSAEAFLGEIPSLPDLSIDLGPMPEMSFARPTFNIPDPPDVTWPTFSVDPPSVSTLNIPTAPGVTLPDPPSLNDIDIPAPPSAAVPEFDGTEPNIDLTPPDVSFAWTEDQYASALLTAITERLESELAIGGQGYGSDVEQAMYDREESRKVDEEEDAYIAVLASGVARGWMTPPGDVVGNVLRISDKISQSREELNSKIINEQTALALKNSHFAIETAIKAETILIDHHNNVQQRSFEAAKFALSSAMEIYKVRAEAFKARVAVYAVLAKVYDAKIRAEIVKAELYKAHIAGLKVGVDVNRQRIDRYKAQLLGVKALVELYKAEMQAGHIIAEVEKTRMQGFMARVEAYRGRVAAVQAEADAYVTQVRGEVIKADMLKADANAYKAEVKAYEAQAQVELEEARASIAVLSAQIQIYNAQVDKYGSEIDRSVGLGKASERLRDAQAHLRVLQARYESATIDLDAALHQARTVEASSIHRSKAIAVEAEQNAMLSTVTASEIGIRAVNEAGTMVAVAKNASSTTYVSRSHRQSVTEASSSSYLQRQSSTWSRSNSLSYSEIINH